MNILSNKNQFAKAQNAIIEAMESRGLTFSKPSAVEFYNYNEARGIVELTEETRNLLGVASEATHLIYSEKYDSLSEVRGRFAFVRSYSTELDAFCSPESCFMILA
jgi:hypothetical protein